MQKKLLGVAVAAALAAPGLALAQSSVQVYGTVHLSINQAKFSSANAAQPAPGVPGGGFGDVTKYGVTSHASNWGLRSTESLGGGMTAWFQAEFNMKMARDNGVHDGDSTARNSGVGLRGAFGNVYLGTWETPWSQTFRLWDVGTIGGWGPTTSIIGRRENTGTNPSRNCTNIQGAAGGVFGANPGGLGTATTAGGATPICGNGAEASTASGGTGGYSLWRRYNYALFYESPVWSGVQAKIAFQPNERKTAFLTPTTTPTAATATVAGVPPSVQENPSSWSGSLTWTGMGGRARAFIANMRSKDWSNVGSTDSGWTLGGGYDFGPANVGAVYEKYTYALAAGDREAKQWAVGLAVPLGSGKIGASYAKAKQLTGAGAPALNDTGAKLWNIGYEWALSKRTALGFGVAKIDNGADIGFSWTGQLPTQDGFTSGSVANGVDQTNLFVSIRHSF